MTQTTTKLEPPDRKQCQGEKQVGAFQLGGRIGERTRCKNEPIVIVRERKPNGKPPKRGSMSLCEACLSICTKQMGADYFDVTYRRTEVRRVQKAGRVRVVFRWVKA